MGIDKPDTRRVLHWGAPQNLEMYYQQIGRAGRDGLDSECIMFADPSDFDIYKSEFYLGGHSSTAQESMRQSLAALKEMAISDSVCRRHSILTHFGEVPIFERCDNCTNKPVGAATVNERGGKCAIYPILRSSKF